jgi:hypothetical protein
MIFYAKQIAGLLEFTNKRALFDFLLSHGDYKGQYIVEIEKLKSKRSLDQNSLYWLYLGVIERETGNLADDLHELFKRKFLPPIPKTILGIQFRLPASTSDLNKAEFGEYLDKICAFTNVPIPQTEKEESTPEDMHKGLEVPKGEIPF